MKFEPLVAHRQRFQAGQPVPHAIYSADGRLLLARGQALASEDQLQTLVDRDAKVDVSEGDATIEKIAKARPEQLPGYWSETMDAMGRVLRSRPDRGFLGALDLASRPLMSLIERDPDLAILQVVHADSGCNPTLYAGRHAIHTATAACMAATRLGWSEAAARSVLRAALTMNLGMAELQNRLVNQVSPLTEQQRAEIVAHPARSVELLETAGVVDLEWLDAVRQHHEVEGGGGYPKGLHRVSEVALLVQCADRFTAKFSARATRPAMAADRAARLQYQSDKGDPKTAALIKEFGIYPPGCTVRLKSGETGVVMRRGESANAPTVAVLTNRSGDALIAPARRDTSKPEHAVAAVLPAASLKVRVGLERLVLCAHA